MVDVAGQCDLQVIRRIALAQPQVQGVGLRLHQRADNVATQEVFSLPLSQAVWTDNEDLCWADAQVHRRAWHELCRHCGNAASLPLEPERSFRPLLNHSRKDVPRTDKLGDSE